MADPRVLAVAVELLDEKAINSADQPSERTNPTKDANVRWADIVKRGLEKRRRSSGIGLGTGI